MPADNPTLRTMSSTRPLQLINEPTVADSLQLNPKSFAVAEHPKNLPKNAKAHIPIVKPQVVPLSSNPKSVESPDNVKYYQDNNFC